MFYLFKLKILGQFRLKILNKHDSNTIAIMNKVAKNTISDSKAIKTAFELIENLPTVQKGKKQFGVKYAFQAQNMKLRVKNPVYGNKLQTAPFYIPGVPCRQFYQSDEFPWGKVLEDNFQIIRDELITLLKNDAIGFKTYKNEYGSLNEGWNTLNFFFAGQKYTENCELCPKTVKILESLPNFEKDHIMISALNPKTHIPPHTGPMNGILRAHLPLIVPNGCSIRIGTEERTWNEGKMLIFDDSFEHQVWNHSNDVRYVLFLNFWHPCFTTDEIKKLEKFRNTINSVSLAQEMQKSQREQRKHDIFLANWNM